jgi:hypothetical protein
VRKSVRYDERDITDVPTDFGARPSPGRLEIVVTNRVAQPSVRVTDERGAPVTAYHFAAVPADPAKWRFAFEIAPGTASQDGVLKLGAMLPGDYVVAAMAAFDFPLLLHDPARIDALATIGTRVTLTEGDSRTFDLRLVTLPPAR